MTEPRELRIGDAERTKAAEELGEHYAQGRLTTEEHNERLDQILQARTRTELAPIFRDLPGSTYAAPVSYPSARMPGVGSDSAGAGSTPTWAVNPPVYRAQRRRSMDRRRGGFPIILQDRAGDPADRFGARPSAADPPRRPRLVRPGPQGPAAPGDTRGCTTAAGEPGG